jgi:hypothetical protein
VAKLQAEFDRYCQDHGYNQARPAMAPMPDRHLHQPDSHDPGHRQGNEEELYVARFDDETGIMTRLSDGQTAPH